ncbi:hypothetical protein M3672_05030, partial [Microbacterium enclense]
MMDPRAGVHTIMPFWKGWEQLFPSHESGPVGRPNDPFSPPDAFHASRYAPNTATTPAEGVP